MEPTQAAESETSPSQDWAAPFRPRLVAFLFDSSLFFILFGLPFIVKNNTGADRSLLRSLPFWIYVLVMHRYWGATLGKMLVGIRVVRMDGGALSWTDVQKRARILIALDLLTCLHPGIGFIAWAWYLASAVYLKVKGQGRTFHDLMADTHVVWKPERRPMEKPRAVPYLKPALALLLLALLYGGYQALGPLGYYNRYDFPRIERHARETVFSPSNTPEGKGERFDLFYTYGPAPDFSFTEGGRTRTFKEERGKVVVLDFWSLGCGPCFRQIPYFNALKKRFEGRPVEIIGLTHDVSNFNRTVHELLKRAKLPPIEYRIGIVGRDVNAKFHVLAVPHAFLIDQKGRIVDKTFDLSTEAGLIDSLLAAAEPGGARREL